MADIKRINVTKVTPGYSGTNKNGNAFTIYDVEASGVTHKLRSFDNLPLGDNEYEVEPYSKDGQTTYTLKPHGWKAPRDPNQGGGVTDGDLQEIKNRLGRIEARVFGSDVTPPVDDWDSGSSGASAGGGGFDDSDIPFRSDFSEASSEHCWNHFT